MSWHVIQTAPQKEFDAARALRERGYTVYVPWREVAKGKQTAWFPRYIFVLYWIPWREMDYRDDNNCIRDRFGRPMLTGTITVCGASEPIDEAVVGRIATEAAMERIESDRPSQPLLKPGDIGLMKCGLEGQTGTIEAIEGEVAKVATKIFNAVRTVKVRVEHLEAA